MRIHKKNHDHEKILMLLVSTLLMLTSCVQINDDAEVLSSQKNGNTLINKSYLSEEEAIQIANNIVKGNQATKASQYVKNVEYILRSGGGELLPTGNGMGVRTCQCSG